MRRYTVQYSEVHSLSNEDLILHMNFIDDEQGGIGTMLLELGAHAI